MFNKTRYFNHPTKLFQFISQLKKLKRKYKINSRINKSGKPSYSVVYLGQLKEII